MVWYDNPSMVLTDNGLVSDSPEGLCGGDCVQRGGEGVRL